MLQRQWLVLAAAAAGILTALVFAAPFLAPYGAFTGLDGNAGYIDNGWQGHGIAGFAYLLGDLFCHQEEARSYVLNGSQMPVCIRDTGILIGATAGFCICTAIGRRLSDRRFAFLGVTLVLLMAVEWAVEGAVGDMPVPRLVSGIGCGFGAAVFLGWMLYRDTQNDVVL